MTYAVWRRRRLTRTNKVPAPSAPTLMITISLRSAPVKARPPGVEVVADEVSAVADAVGVADPSPLVTGSPVLGELHPG